MKLGPVTFLFLVAATWATVRAVMLWPDDREQRPPRQITWHNRMPRSPNPTPITVQQVQNIALPKSLTSVISARKPAGVAIAFADQTMPVALLAASISEESDQRRQVTPIYSPAPVSPHQEAPGLRLSTSVWGIVRGRAGPGLASAGQLGGNQAGVRVRYELGSGVAAAVRLSSPLSESRGKEAAVGIDWRPASRVPFTFTIERRFGLDSGGRNAFAAGVVGGFDKMIAPELRLDGYAQAGLVGLRERDGYVDGALGVQHHVARLGKTRVGAGAGLWGGAQPGVSRLDIGPQLVAQIPLGKHGVRLAAEWRERVAGQALPGSGPVLTLGADF